MSAVRSSRYGNHLTQYDAKLEHVPASLPCSAGIICWEQLASAAIWSHFSRLIVHRQVVVVRSLHRRARKLLVRVGWSQHTACGVPLASRSHVESFCRRCHGCPVCEVTKEALLRKSFERQSNDREQNEARGRSAPLNQSTRIRSVVGEFVALRLGLEDFEPESVSCIPGD